MSEKLSVHGENSFAVSRKTCEKLILEPDGNAARLWLLLTSEGEMSPEEAAMRLSVSDTAIKSAFAALSRAGLCGLQTSEPSVPQELTAQDVRVRKDSDGYFAWLLAYAEQTVGRTLSANDTVTLLRVCDRYGLLPDTVPILLRYCADRVDPEGDTGRRTTMYQVEKTAAEWERQGIDTPAKADEFVKKDGLLQERIRTLLHMQNIYSTTPAVERTVAAWFATGLSPEVLSYACDLTVSRTGSLKWSYADTIIRSWLSKGLRSVEAIKREENLSDKKKETNRIIREKNDMEQKKEAIRKANARANGGEGR